MPPKATAPTTKTIIATISTLRTQRFLVFGSRKSNTNAVANMTMAHKLMLIGFLLNAP